jgi:hypothetical protein
VGPAAQALTAWLEASGVNSGAIFRRVRKTKAVEPLAGQAIWLIVKRRAQLAGVAGDFGAHSLRSGFVTEAGRRNVPLGEDGTYGAPECADLSSLFQNRGRSEYKSREADAGLNQTVTWLVFHPRAGAHAN